MVSGEMIAVLGTLAGSVAGATITGVVSHYNTKIQQDNQNKRQRAEHYIDKKVEYLTDLYDAFLRCESIVRGVSGTYEGRTEMWEKYAEERSESEVQEAFEELETAVRRGSIFLEDEDAKEISGAMMSVGGLFQEMGAGEPGINDDHQAMERFREDVDEAKWILREEISSPVNNITRNE